MPLRFQPDERGRQQVRVDPADSPAVELPRSNKRRNLLVRHHLCRIDELVARQQSLAAARIADQELTVDELVAPDLVPPEQRIQFARVGSTVREKADPYRRVDQHAHAVARLA